MSLKELLGEELFEQVNEKLDDDTKLIVNDGNYIPKEKFDEKSEKVAALEKQISQRDEQIEQLKEDTNTSEELKSKIEELQEKNEKTKTELQEKLEQQKLDSEIDKALLKNKARNPKAVKALLEMDKVELTDDGVKGLEDQLKSLKENDDYLFELENNSSSAGDDFKGGNKGGTTITMEQVDNMTEEEINDNWEAVSKVLSQQQK
jgi:predicted RNase H-like nuclease (RuvC/YqgF family)